MRDVGNCARLFCISVVLSSAAGCAHEHAAPSTTPPISLLDLNDRPFDLWRHDPEHVVVAIFTRTDCPISNRYAPEIRRLDDAYRARGVDFYLVYVDPRGQSDDIRRHLQDYEYRCTALRDPKHSLVGYCNAKVTPEAVVFDKDRAITYQGRISDQYVELGNARAGPARHDLADAIEATALGQPVTTPRTKAVGCAISDLKD